MLVVWSKYDPSFTVAGATAYADDVPGLEVHILEAGHFALDEATDEIAVLVRDFLEGLGRTTFRMQPCAGPLGLRERGSSRLRATRPQSTSR